LGEIERLRRRMNEMIVEHQAIIDDLSDRRTTLEMDLATRDSELLQEKQLKEDLLRHTEEASKYHEYESEYRVPIKG